MTGGHNIANPFDAATITIPNAATLQESGNTTFTARLYVNGELMAADSVSVNKEPKTTVEGNPQKVDRIDNEQSTGLKIVNKDGHTEVSAVDASSKKIPETVNDKTGEISVTPGTDAKGPIKVTVKDPDLKDGESTYEVPVTSDTNTPEGQDVAVKVGETPKAEDAIKNKDALPKGATFKFEEAPDTSKEGTVPAKVIVTYPDGSTDEVTTTINVKDLVKVIADENGNYKVEVPGGTTLKDGDTVKVTAKDEGKVEASNSAKISKPESSDSSIAGLTQDEANKCDGASAASAIPLLLLTPIALGLAMDNQQVKDLTAGFGQQLEDINTGIQKTLGIYNPELAQQFKVQVAPHLQNLALAAGFIASIALLAGVAADQCVPGGGSSDNTAAQK